MHHACTISCTRQYKIAEISLLRHDAPAAWQRVPEQHDFAANGLDLGPFSGVSGRSRADHFVVF